MVINKSHFFCYYFHIKTIIHISKNMLKLHNRTQSILKSTWSIPTLLRSRRTKTEFYSLKNNLPLKTNSHWYSFIFHFCPHTRRQFSLEPHSIFIVHFFCQAPPPRQLSWEIRSISFAISLGKLLDIYYALFQEKRKIKIKLEKRLHSVLIAFSFIENDIVK